METNGEQLVHSICNMLKIENKNVLLYDNKIVQKIRGLTWRELEDIIVFEKYSDRWVAKCSKKQAKKG